LYIIHTVYILEGSAPNFLVHARYHRTHLCASTNPLLPLKIYCQTLLKTRSERFALKRSRHTYFCGWPFCIWICRSFPFSHNMGREYL